jgi:hypothetical protein
MTWLFKSHDVKEKEILLFPPGMELFLSQDNHILNI